MHLDEGVSLPFFNNVTARNTLNKGKLLFREILLEHVKTLTLHTSVYRLFRLNIQTAALTLCFVKNFSLRGSYFQKEYLLWKYYTLKIYSTN